MVHVEQPGNAPATKMEISFQGLKPSEAEKLKSDIDDTIRESLSEFNLSDDFIREETSSGTAIHRPR